MSPVLDVDHAMAAQTTLARTSSAAAEQGVEKTKHAADSSASVER
jgi:hypothetical protein